MQLCIQDPSYSKSMYLHESILMACKDGVLGGGAYAFASQGGVELLFADEAFNKFMNAGSFYLIVGMDDITNIKTLKALQNYIEQYKGHLIYRCEEIIQETPELSIWKRIGGDCYDEK